MRAFIAIDLPENVRDRILGVQEKLPEFKGKLTEIENIHLTLKFLGEVENIELVKEKLSCIKFRKFKIRINKAGVFSENLVRIVWLGVDSKCKELWELQKEIDEKLEDLFPEEKRFMGHITIARVKSLDKNSFLSKLKEIKVNIEFEVESFKVKKSVLTAEKPVYEDVLKVDLE
jgi:2'-5' RNA ligase